MSTVKYDLPLLDWDTRFSLWQVKMRAVLSQTDLDDALDGFDKKDSSTWTDEEKRKDRKAKSHIHLHLSNNILQEVLAEKSAAALWLRLESICMSKDLTSKMQVKMKLFTHKLQEGGSVLNHISSFKEIVADLQSMEVKYDDEDLALLLLCSLPGSYPNFRDTILYSRDELTLHEVCEALSQKEKMKQMVRTDDSAPNGEALSVRGREEQRNKKPGDRGRSKSAKKDKFCRYCKKNNHVIEDCYKLQNKEKRNGTNRSKNKSGENGKASVAVGDDSDGGEILIAFAGCVSMNSEWILDSACSYHVCTNKDWFSSYEPVQNGGWVRMGDNTPCEIIGIGSVKIRMHDGMIRTLTEVRHVPSMSRNLISLSTLDNKGYGYSALGGVMKVSKGSLVVMKGVMKAANLYALCGDTITGTAAVSSAAAAVTSDNCSVSKLWHMRLGHMSQLGLAELSKRGLLKGYNNDEMEFCEHCIFGKHKRVKFNTAVHSTEGILDYVHADLWGPSRKTSLGGCRYMLTIIDDYSRRVFPYFLKNKSDAFDSFKAWKVMVEKQTDRKVKVLRTDNGMEFCSDEFKTFCRKEGIVRHHTIPHTPQQNGVAERMNRTIISKARCMLSNATMGRQFWAEAANTACYLINRSPSIAIEKKTPMEVWSGSPSDYSQLKVFGCTAFAHVDNGKLEPRAVKCVFLGYGSGVKGFKLWNPETKKSMLSRSVVFNESEMYYATRSTNSSDDVPKPQKVSLQVENLDEGDHDDHDDDDAQQTQVFDADSPPPVVQPMAVSRPQRIRKPVKRLIEECNVSYALSCAEEIGCSAEPSTYTEATISADREKWIAAIQEEMQSLEKNGTWDIVRLPAGKKAVRCKWIFKRKEGSSPTEPARFKARLVAKGFSQIPGIDYNDVYSPVVKHSSIRVFLGIVAMHDLELEQLDVKTAFLHGDLEEEIYMDQPEGYITPGKENFVCKLKKSLYGLKQSPRQWYKKFDSFMFAHGFKRSLYDSCVYVKFIDGAPIYLLLYVDDMLIAA